MCVCVLCACVCVCVCVLCVCVCVCVCVCAFGNVLGRGTFFASYSFSFFCVCNVFMKRKLFAVCWVKDKRIEAAHCVVVERCWAKENLVVKI